MQVQQQLCEDGASASSTQFSSCCSPDVRLHNSSSTHTHTDLRPSVCLSTWLLMMLTSCTTDITTTTTHTSISFQRLPTKERSNSCFFGVSSFHLGLPRCELRAARLPALVPRRGLRGSRLAEDIFGERSLAAFSSVGCGKEAVRVENGSRTVFVGRIGRG